MSRQRVKIERLPTGVPHLDDVLGGGLPEYSLTIIGGLAGAGKTTLAQQIVFRNAAAGHPAIYFSTLGEPALKLLRYQQQFEFFDAEKVGTAVHIVDLAPSAARDGIEGALKVIIEHVKRLSPRIVVIDSFRAVEDLAAGSSAVKRFFAHDLAVVLASSQCTGFLIGEYADDEIGIGPEFTVADNVLLLSQELQHNSVVRRLRVVKIRGQAPQPGRHAFRITSTGLDVFPRLPAIADVPRHPKGERAGFGIRGLDEMTRGGLPRGQTCIVAGSSGTGKTLLALHFAVHGAEHGEPCVMATFEESPAEHAEKMAAFGWDLADLERRRLVHMLYLRPVDLSIDEVLYSINIAIARSGARRVIVNSISGLEIALPQTERQELREGLYRMTANLTAQGTTVLMTTEVPTLLGEMQLSAEGISFLADNIILLRYVEIAAELRRALSVFKMRTSAHDISLREYRIGRTGITVEEPFRQYSGVLTGIPTLSAILEPRPYTAGLAEADQPLMHTLLALKQATVEELAEALGAPMSQTRTMLERLAETGYIIKTTRGARPVYRVALFARGGGPPRRK
jgi:circadian clock protein KaiC